MCLLRHSCSKKQNFSVTKKGGERSLLLVLCVYVPLASCFLAFLTNNALLLRPLLQPKSPLGEEEKNFFSGTSGPAGCLP